MAARIQEDVPDLVVGIDFGMTYTGVAWTNLSNATQSIDDWPGLQDSHESKVPTKIIYGNGPGNKRVKKWGFLCEEEEESGENEIFENFKIFLDQSSIDAARRVGVRDMPRSTDDAKRLITDYLQEIYQQVKCSIEASTGPWRNKKVEFLFSTPTTWYSHSITNDFEEAIRAAGFGEENTSKHTAKLDLTEAEAAAVYVAANPQVRFANGDIILVCDSGGGTTDLGLLEVIDANPQLPALKQVAAVKGVGIGSTMIDRAFQKLVQKRLNNNPDAQTTLPRNLAQKLANSVTFRAVKHNFGARIGDQPEYKFPLDRLGLGISQDYSHPGLRIERGRMHFPRTEIQNLFDIQINGIIRCIDEELEWMRKNGGGESVKYLVLSGGLGGSAYVKTQLEQKYASHRISIIRSQEPRLSVVKGLVMDRKQKLTTGTAALKTRIARASYGVLCRQPYSPECHVGADIEMDHFNKKQKWALNQIDWLIRKGDVIDTDSARELPFNKKISPGDTNREWDTIIIMSHNDRESLPRMMKQSGAVKLCIVKSDLREVSEKEFELKNKRCWQGPTYYIATFTLRVLVGPSDLKFELWFKGTKYNRSHEPVKIEWDQAAASARPPRQGGGSTANDAWEGAIQRPLPGRHR